MSVKIRLTKVGKTHQISYRVVATDSKAKRDGAFLEILGYFNPLIKVPAKLNHQRIDYWVSKGAQPTIAVKKLLDISKNQSVKNPSAP